MWTTMRRTRTKTRSRSAEAPSSSDSVPRMAVYTTLPTYLLQMQTTYERE